VKRVFYKHPPKIDGIRLRNTVNPLLSVQMYAISVRRHNVIYATDVVLWLVLLIFTRCDAKNIILSISFILLRWYCVIAVYLYRISKGLRNRSNKKTIIMPRKSEWNKRCCSTVAVDGFRNNNNNNNICRPPSPAVVNQFIGDCGRRQKRPRGRLESICIHLRTQRRQYYIRRASAFITAGCCRWWCCGGEGGGSRNNGYTGGWIRRIIIRNDTRGRNKWQQQQCNRCGVYTHTHTTHTNTYAHTHTYAYNIFMYVWTGRFIPYSVYDTRAIIY